MKKDKKIKIYLGLIYLLILSLFLWAFFSNFSLNDLTSYDFIKDNRNHLVSIKERNFFFISFLFIIISIIWVFLLGFGLPILIPAGFIFGKWIGTILCIFSLSVGATFLYLFASYFFKDLIEEKFSKNFKNLSHKFKKNEFTFFLIYRFVGGIPFQIQNLLPVLFDVKVRNYFFGTLFGIAPQIFVWVSLGSGIEKIIDQNIEFPSFKDLILSQDIYLPIIGFLILMISALLVKNFFYKD
tara:strand:+ start:62 stop:781 length:720 start_codon:yes stop_codon:yes gene_type:complete